MKQRPRYYYFLIAAVLAVGGIYVADIIGPGFFRFLFATIGCIGAGFLLFGPYEMYKVRKKKKTFMKDLAALMEGGTVATRTINAKRIAKADDYKDEGDLYIIEYDTDKLLFLWDVDFSMSKKFPCLHFEIYEDKFFKLLGRSLYSHSGRIQPVKIDYKAKWNYITKVGAPAHMETRNVNFDKLVEEINNSLNQPTASGTQ